MGKSDYIRDLAWRGSIGIYFVIILFFFHFGAHLEAAALHLNSPSDNLSSKFNLKVSPIYVMNALYGKDLKTKANGLITSKRGYGFDGTISSELPDGSSEVSMSLSYLNMLYRDPVGIELEKNTFHLFDSNVGMTKKIGKKVAVTGVIGHKDKLFMARSSYKKSKLQQVHLPYSKATLSVILADKPKWRATAKGTYINHLGKKISNLEEYKSGHGYQVGVDFTTKGKDYSLFASYQYEKSFQKSNIVSQREETVKTSVGVVWNF